MNRSEAGKRGYEKTKDQINEYLEKRSQKAREAYEADPKFCPFCGERITFERRTAKFCNSSCAASFNNRGVIRNSGGIKTARYCSCGNVITRRNQYCDVCTTNRVFNKHETLAECKDDRSRKRLLLEERGHRCQKCGFEMWNGIPITLELDHIDGDADNNTDENLRLICPNCHSQTETYKGANAGKGSTRQKMRRKRYAEGKTY